jgi:phosphoserine aminotransferase
LEIPDGFHLVFTSSANEIWERILQNVVEKKSLHLVNGAFSQKFHSFAQQLNLEPLIAKVQEGQCVDISGLKFEENIEMVALTHNETSTGAMITSDDIDQVRKMYPDALITLDVVSSVPFVEIDYQKIDSAYFSVQKGFGLPAGLGVWIYNERMLEKARTKSKLESIGTYHSLLSLHQKGLDNQTPETPNMLAIYLLACVCKDMNEIGIKKIRNETIYKATLLYQIIDRVSFLHPFVRHIENQSKTVIVAEKSPASPEIIEILNQSGMAIGTGYGKYKNEHIRIANFPAHSKEQIEMLCDRISTL